MERSLRIECNRIPEIAAARKEQADMYRRVRTTDPKTARLLYFRVRNAYKILSNALIENVYGDFDG